MKKTILVILVLSFAMAFGQQYQLKKHVVGGGGATVSNSNYTFSGTIGQAATGLYQNNDNNLYAGFWTPEPGEDILNITLEQGWNLISSNVTPTSLALEDIFNQISSEVVIVRNDNKIYVPSFNYNTIGNWGNTHAYRVYAKTQQTLSIIGSELDPSNLDYNFTGGEWDEVSYSRNSAMDAATAYASIASDLVIVKNNDGDVYIPALNINQIGNLTPGQGYRAYFANNITNFNFPANGLPKFASNDNYDYTPKHFLPKYERTGNDATIIITSNNLTKDYEIGVFNADGEIVGGAKSDRYNAIVTIWGDDDQTEIEDGALQNEDLILKAYNVITNETFELQISNLQDLSNPANIDFDYQTDAIYKANISGLPEVDSFVELSVKPNPATEIISISYFLEQGAEVELFLSNSLGQKVAVIDNSYKSAGYHSMSYHINDLRQGSYMLNLRAGNDFQNIKVMVVR